MPIQPGLALQVKGLELPDPLAMQAQATQIQNALQQQRMGEMQIQNAMREQRRTQELESLMAGFSPEAPAPEVARKLQERGFFQQAGQTLQQAALRDKTAREAQAARFTEIKTKAELAGRIFSGVSDQGSYTAARTRAIQQNLATADEIPEAYDKAAVDRIVRNAIDVPKALELEYKGRQTAAQEATAKATGVRGEAAMISARAAEARAGQEQVPASIREFRAAQAMPKAERTAFEAFQAAKRPTTTINMQQESALRKELGETQGKIVSDGYKAAEDAISTMDTINIGRDLLNKGVVTGFGADFLVNTGQALKQVGIDLNSDAAANAQTYAATLAGNVGRLIKLFGAGTGLSNADREYAEKMAGGKISLDERALRRILDINERSARNVITKHNANVDRFKAGDEFKIEMPPERTSTLPPRDQQALDWARSNPTDPRSAQILKRLGME
jgi:hypothetical protein